MSFNNFKLDIKPHVLAVRLANPQNLDIGASLSCTFWILSAATRALGKVVSINIGKVVSTQSRDKER